jgi:hypothetical protein
MWDDVLDRLGVPDDPLDAEHDVQGFPELEIALQQFLALEGPADARSTTSLSRGFVR